MGGYHVTAIRIFKKRIGEFPEARSFALLKFFGNKINFTAEWSVFGVKIMRQSEARLLSSFEIRKLKSPRITMLICGNS